MFPHLVTVGARPEIIGKLLGVPVTLSAIARTGTDDAFERKIALRTFYTDITDVDSLLACVREIHAWRPVDALLAGTEHALLPTAIVADALGVRANPVEAVTLAQDKAAMRRRLAERGLETMAHRVCTDPEEVRELLDACPGGVILKPADGNGGRGIALVRTPDDIATAWAHTAPESRSKGVLAEEFLTGLELSVETMSAEGRHIPLVVPAKRTSGAPYFVEVAHQIPGGHSEHIAKIATEAVIAALDAIGYAYGPTNTEVMVDGDRGTVVEINPRWGGARYWEMIELATGVSMAESTAMALAYGRLPTPSTVALANCAVRLLTPPSGRIVSITGLEEATAVPGVVRIGELNRIGDVMPALTDFRGRAGYVLATGSDPEDAAATVEQAASLLRMQTVPALSSAKDIEAMGADLRSAVRALLPDLKADAETYAELLREAGAATVETLDEGVVARCPAPPDMPTVLLHARGSVEPAHLAALRLFDGRPPVGLVVFVEETGMPSDLAADVVVTTSTSSVADDATGRAASVIRSAFETAYGAGVISVGSGSESGGLVVSGSSNDVENACVATVLFLTELARKYDKAQPARAI